MIQSVFEGATTLGAKNCALNVVQFFSRCDYASKRLETSVQLMMFHHAPT